MSLGSESLLNSNKRNKFKETQGIVSNSISADEIPTVNADSLGSSQRLIETAAISPRFPNEPTTN
jgi:hypothetical protein